MDGHTQCAIENTNLHFLLTFSILTCDFLFYAESSDRNFKLPKADSRNNSSIRSSSSIHPATRLSRAIWGYWGRLLNAYTSGRGGSTHLKILFIGEYPTYLFHNNPDMFGFLSLVLLDARMSPRKYIRLEVHIGNRTYFYLGISPSTGFQLPDFKACIFLASVLYSSCVLLAGSDVGMFLSSRFDPNS